MSSTFTPSLSASPRERLTAAIAHVVDTEGAGAVTIAKVRRLARTDNGTAAEVVKTWRNSTKAAETSTSSQITPAVSTSAGEALIVQTVRSMVIEAVEKAQAEAQEKTADELRILRGALDNSHKDRDKALDDLDDANDKIDELRRELALANVYKERADRVDKAHAQELARRDDEHRAEVARMQATIDQLLATLGRVADDTNASPVPDEPKGKPARKATKRATTATSRRRGTRATK